MRSAFLAACVFAVLVSTASAQFRRVPAEGKPYAAAVTVPAGAPLLYTTQILPDGTAAKANAQQQAVAVLRQIAVLAQEHKSSLDNIVKLNFYVAELEGVAAVEKALTATFTGKHQPAVSFVVTRLPQADALVGADAVIALFLPRSTPFPRSTRAALLPAGTRIFVSGQAEKGTLAEATRATLVSLRKSLEFAGGKEDSIVQVKAFLTPMADAKVVLKTIADYYGDKLPPVSLVEWQSSLPIEIEIVAAGTATKSAEPLEFLTPPGMTASPVYSRVARVARSPLIYISSIYAAPNADPNEEVSEMFGHLKKILDAAGSDFRHLPKATYYVTRGETTKAMGAVRPRHYDPKRPPSASLAQVAGTGRAGCTVTLDMIAIPAQR